jgi:hypothetical protein
MNNKMIKIIQSDKFTSMTQETQLLFMIMVQYMDKNKQVQNSKTIMRSHGIKDISLEILISNGYLSRNAIFDDIYTLVV